MSATTASLMNNYPRPEVTFLRGSGAYLWDDHGKKYLDMLSGIAVNVLGHSHPAVTAAVKTQVDKLIHTSNLFANEHTEYVVTCLDHLLRIGTTSKPDGETVSHGESVPHGRMLFQNSGAEATEAAIKLVRKYQGCNRHKVVSAYGSFHGRTLASLAATGQPSKHTHFQPMPAGFLHAPFNDIEALISVVDQSVGAVLLESVQGEGGVHPASVSYLEDVRAFCSERGVLLIMDEVQTGLARTGEWFGYQHAKIQPDIVTLAKPLANGMPVGAVWASSEVAAAFVPGDHGSTFAGQALTLAAVRAVLDVMIEMNAPSVARRLGQLLATELNKLSCVEHVRGKGMLLGVEMTSTSLAGRTARDVASACLKQGLVVGSVTETALRLAPSLIVTEQQIHNAVEVIGSVMSDCDVRL